MRWKKIKNMITNQLRALPPGTYVVAVSGGVDSVVLLSILVTQYAGRNDMRLIVAHVDHGIRPDSSEDAVFVQNLAKEYGLPYESIRFELGQGASEALAREKRYAFLRAVQQQYNAQAILTGHHQDDLIETSILNLLRGTGRNGLTSLRNRPDILRPLLTVTKKEMIMHATNQGLLWREDDTNKDQSYTRNHVRHAVVANLSDEQRRQWLEHLQIAEQINQRLDNELAQMLRRGLHKGQPVLSRSWFRLLPHAVAREVVVSLLRSTGAVDIDRRTVERLVVAIKVLPHGKVVQAAGVQVMLNKRSARFLSVAKGSQSSKKAV